MCIARLKGEAPARTFIADSKVFVGRILNLRRRALSTDCSYTVLTAGSQASAVCPDEPVVSDRPLMW